LFRPVVGKTHVDRLVTQDEAVDHPADFGRDVEEAEGFALLISAGLC
jgi:hypothetical protein